MSPDLMSSTLDAVLFRGPVVDHLHKYSNDRLDSVLNSPSGGVSPPRWLDSLEDLLRLDRPRANSIKVLELIGLFGVLKCLVCGA